jgi:hypothetical protein
VGIEPDLPKLSPRLNGFEVRAGHQTRFASAKFSFQFSVFSSLSTLYIS